MTIELLVGDFGELVEVEGEFYARLGVGFYIVGELGVGEFVVNFLECHFWGRIENNDY
jgi:hypothetical protein